jgi:hypothetical protein
MTTTKKSLVPHSDNAQAANDAPGPSYGVDVEHLFFRIDAIPITTATGGVIWKASIPQFSGINSIHANKEIAILTIFEKLPDAFWERIRNPDKNQEE